MTRARIYMQQKSRKYAHITYKIFEKKIQNMQLVIENSFLKI